MKIGVVGLRGLGWEGGIESYCNYIYPHIAADTHEIVFHTRRRYGTERRWNGMKVVPLAAIPFNGFETLSYTVAAYWQALVVERVDVIHVQAIGSGLLLPFARLARVGTVVRHVGADWERPKWGKLGRFALRSAELIVGRFADVVVCLDETTAREFSGRTGARAEIVVIGNAVPKAIDHISTEALPSGLEPGRYILSVSRISEEKGILEMIEAYHCSGLNDQGISLAIAGEVFGRGDFKKKVRARAVEVAGCLLLGQKERAEVARLLDGARAFVNASTHEGMSFSALEALARGCACLLSDIRENRTIGRGHAHYFPLKDTLALADALLWICNAPRDPDARDSQRSDILALHNVDDAARSMQTVLERAHCLARGTLGSEADTADLSKTE